MLDEMRARVRAELYHTMEDIKVFKKYLNGKLRSYNKFQVLSRILVFANLHSHSAYKFDVKFPSWDPMMK